MNKDKTADKETIWVAAKVMEEVFFHILLKKGLTAPKAKTCAKIFMENSLDGVTSHGINRFPRFISYIKKGYIKVHEEAAVLQKVGAIAQWDGRLGPGPLNALKCTDGVMELASENGIGCVAISNTNHWMRGGTYGWKAAKAGFLLIAWTNTVANMPAWGAINNKIGNNPLVIAIPYFKEAIVLDMAMSQFSFGALESFELKGEQLPVAGGFNQEGCLTQDPSAILSSNRILPAGNWKGAGLSLLLDILATVLSGGLSTAEISKKEAEYGVSQVFIAIDLKKLPEFSSIHGIVDNIIQDYKASVPDDKRNDIVYPGERVIKTRERNLAEGIPVNRKIWEEVVAL